MLDASSILAYSTNFIGAFMNYRKTKARRNRYFTENIGNSKGDNALFTNGKRREYANFKEAMFELNEYKCPVI